MAKKNATDTLENEKEKLLEALEHLKESLNLGDDEIRVIKEWGVALLVTGVSVFVVYQLIKKVFGYKKDVPVIEAEPSSSRTRIKESSPVSRMIKEQLALFLIAFVKQRLMKFLESKHILDEGENT